jgi:hypothetical protein
VHRGLKALLAVAGIALAGCSAQGDPQVAFYSHGKSIEVDPTGYCDPTGAHCASPSKDATGELAIPPRSPVQISVPQQVFSAPWQVSFLYRGPNGEQIGDRTPVFPPNQQYAYTLRPPQGMQLEHVEVQEYSGLLAMNPDGSLVFPIVGDWVLDAR